MQAMPIERQAGPIRDRPCKDTSRRKARGGPRFPGPAQPWASSPSGSLASIRMKAIMHGSVPLLTQLCTVPR